MPNGSMLMMFPRAYSSAQHCPGQRYCLAVPLRIRCVSPGRYTLFSSCPGLAAHCSPTKMLK